MYEYWGCDDSRVIPIVGDLTQANWAFSKADIRKLKGKIEHFFHLAAVYDLKASAEEQQRANVDGTRNTVQLAEEIGAKHFHLVSSIAAAGLFEGCFAKTCSTKRKTSTTPTSAPSTIPRASCARSAGSRGASSVRRSSSATRAPARWTRSTAPTTSSS
jgi:thioester reductase-like protein